MRHSKLIAMAMVLLALAWLIRGIGRLFILVCVTAFPYDKPTRKATALSIERARRAAYFKAKYPRQYVAAGIVAKRK